MTCTTAAEAIALLATSEVQPHDLLLTDIALGSDKRGTGLARQAQGRWPALPVLLMSGYADELLGQPPASPLLNKPYSRDGLARALAQARR